MQTSLTTVLALASSAMALAVRDIDPAYPKALDVKKYPNGLPEELKPGHHSVDVKRDGNAGVYLCNDANWQGYCVHIVQPKNECINLSGDLDDLVSSVGPDYGYTCTFYSAFKCLSTEGNFTTGYPGYSDLSQFNNEAGNWNDRISSYICN